MSANRENEIRLLVEALHAQGVEYEKLLRIIVSLGRGQEKALVVDVFADALVETPVEKNDCVLFGNLALRFDEDGTLIDVYKAVPRTTRRSEVVIVDDADL